jgi:hypothetical protein
MAAIIVDSVPLRSNKKKQKSNIVARFGRQFLLTLSVLTALGSMNFENHGAVCTGIIWILTAKLTDVSQTNHRRACSNRFPDPRPISGPFLHCKI